MNDAKNHYAIPQTVKTHSSYCSACDGAFWLCGDNVDGAVPKLRGYVRQSSGEPLEHCITTDVY